MSGFRLPTDRDEVTIVGIIGTLELAAAREFAEFLNNKFNALGQPKWFEDIRQYRLSNNEPFTYRDAADLRFILSEAALPDSQIWDLIPRISTAWVNAADALRKKLNQYHHLQLNPTLETLDQVATLFDAVTTGPGLEVSSWARALRGRVRDIQQGRFVASPAEGPVTNEPTPASVVEIEKGYEESKRQIAKRPPWGAIWEGPIPARKLSLDRRTRDIYDNGVSVASELGDQFDHIVNMWLRYAPNGGEVWVDEDGATMAFVKGDPVMIGWFGTPPDEYSESVRGFLVPKDYEFTGDDVQELPTGKLLSSSSEEDSSELIGKLKSKLEPGTLLGITEYGDICIQVAEGEPKRITTAHKGIWFKGQLPG